jgi:hypothetical protein
MNKWVSGSLGLLFALIVLMVALNLLKKVPVVGKAAGVAQNLATEGHL